MKGTFHIVHLDATYTSIGKKESITAACGKVLIRGEDDYCNISMAGPNLNYDWCHDCVKAFPWRSKSKKAWLERGIEVLDPSSWVRWLRTPEGEYARKK